MCISIYLYLSESILYIFGPTMSHQAVENVGTVMSNVLKVQQRMTGLMEKLTGLGSTEATETFILYSSYIKHACTCMPKTEQIA